MVHTLTNYACLKTNFNKGNEVCWRRWSTMAVRIQLSKQRWSNTHIGHVPLSVCLSISLNIRVNKQTPGVVAHHFSLHPSGSWANTFDTVQSRVFKRLNTSRAYYIEVRAKNIQPLARFLDVYNQRTLYITSCCYASKKCTIWCTLIPRVKWLKAGRH